MKKRYIILMFCSLCMIYSNCNSEDIIVSINKIRDYSRMNHLSQALIREVKDSIQKWHQDSVLRYSSYMTNAIWFFDDLVLFNSDSTKAMSFIYKIYLDIADTTQPKLNYIKIYALEKKNGGWKYYFAALPTIGFYSPPKEDVESVRKLLENEINKILVNHFNIVTNSINDDIIENYFLDNGLEGTEQEFWEREAEEKLKNATIKK